MEDQERIERFWEGRQVDDPLATNNDLMYEILIQLNKINMGICRIAKELGSK